MRIAQANLHRSGVEPTRLIDEREGSPGHPHYSGEPCEEATPGLTVSVRNGLLGQIQTAMGGLTAGYLFTGKRNINGATGDLAIIELTSCMACSIESNRSRVSARRALLSPVRRPVIWMV